MKKQKKLITILAVCMIISLFIIGKISIPSEKKDKNEEWINAEEIVSLEIKNRLDNFTIQNKQDQVLILGLEDVPIDSSKVKKNMNNLNNLEISKTISDGNKRLDDFGLDTPEAELRINLSGDNEKTLLIGNEVPDKEKESRYVYWEDNVCVMTGKGFDEFFYGKEYYIEQQVTPSYVKDSEPIIVQKVVLEKQNEKRMVVELNKSEVLAGYVSNTYNLTEPKRYPAKLDITENFLPSVFDIWADEVVEINPEKKVLEKYGLQNPYVKISVNYNETNTKENEFLLTASKPDSDGNIYIMKEGIPVIYQCKSENLIWVECDYKSMINNLVITANIKSLSAIKVKTDEKLYEIELKNVGKEDEMILCNGQNIDSESFRNTYYMLISQEAEEVKELETSSLNGMKKVLELEFSFSNINEKETVTYYEESERILQAISSNSDLCYKVLHSTIHQFIANIEKLVDGQTVEARY